MTAGEDLGREVQGRAGQTWCGGAHFFSGAKVHEDDAAGLVADDVLGLDVAVQQTCRMHRRDRATEVGANPRRGIRRHHTVHPHDLIERSAADEFHPDSDAPLLTLRPVDVHDMGMSDSREPPRFLQHAGVGGRVPGHAVEPQQLEGHLALQVGFPRAEDVTRRALPDAVEQDQSAPPGPHGIRLDDPTAPPDISRRRRQRPIDLRKRVDQTQVADQAGLGV